MRKRKFTSFLHHFVLFSSFCLPLCGDARTENINIILVLDKSSSMEEEIGEVRNYVINDIVNSTLIPGDGFYVLAFYGKTEEIIAEKSVNSGTMDTVRMQIGRIKADGVYTDIGNALDNLVDLAESPMLTDDRLKYVLLLTDGRQEAPPGSPYQSADYTVQHSLLERTRILRDSDWKIIVIGLGDETEARKVAEMLSAGIVEIEKEPTREVLAETTRDLLGLLPITSEVTMTPVNRDGQAVLKFTCTPSGYNQTVPLIITKITLRIDDRNYTINSTPVTLNIIHDRPNAIELPVHFPAGFNPDGTVTGSLGFAFGGLNILSPAQAAVRIRIQSWLERNRYLFVVIPAGLAILTVLTVAALKAAGRRKEREEEKRTE